MHALYGAIISMKELGFRQLKPEQAEAFVKGRDVFPVLPTGYGKSLCYSCLLLVFDRLHGEIDRSSCFSLNSYYERSGKLSN